MLAHLAAEIQPICWGQQAMQLSGPYTALSSTQCSCIDPTARRFTCCRPPSIAASQQAHVDDGRVGSIWVADGTLAERSSASAVTQEADNVHIP